MGTIKCGNCRFLTVNKDAEMEYPWCTCSIRKWEQYVSCEEDLEAVADCPYWAPFDSEKPQCANNKPNLTD